MKRLFWKTAWSIAAALAVWIHDTLKAANARTAKWEVAKVGLRALSAYSDFSQRHQT